MCNVFISVFRHVKVKEVKKEPEIENSDGEAEPGEYVSESHSDR